jgi:lysophospholipase L1-like esterase
MATAQKTEVVACLGSSSTAGQGQAFGWIDELAARPENAHFLFKNLGVGGDFAFDALKRVPAVVASNPDRIVVLIGANDVLAMVFPNVQRFLGGFMKRHPQPASPAWFKENLTAIVTQLKGGTNARIALSSLGPIGEAPSSTDPNQNRLNELIAQFSTTIKEAASQYGTAYLPFYEELTAAIAASPGKALTAFRFLPVYADTFRYYALRQTSDQIAAVKGWKFHVDGVHLNRRGGLILAGLVQEFLDS